MYNYSYKIPSNQNEKPDLQIYDLLQISRYENELRKDCISALRHYNLWKRLQNECAIESPEFFNSAKSRARARQAFLRYRQVRDYRKSVFHDYLRALPAYGAARIKTA
jgi:hypothetical protein